MRRGSEGRFALWEIEKKEGLVSNRRCQGRFSWRRGREDVQDVEERMLSFPRSRERDIDVALADSSSW